MCNGKCGCVVKKTCKVLLIIGGLNWGLVGVGMLMNSDWNVVKMIFGSIPTLEAIVYILVGVAAIMKIFGCRCKKCMATCASCESHDDASSADKQM